MKHTLGLGAGVPAWISEESLHCDRHFCAITMVPSMLKRLDNRPQSGWLIATVERAGVAIPETGLLIKQHHCGKTGKLILCKPLLSLKNIWLRCFSAKTA
jgi:hypothetical protein